MAGVTATLVTACRTLVNGLSFQGASLTAYAYKPLPVAGYPQPQCFVFVSAWNEYRRGFGGGPNPTSGKKWVEHTLHLDVTNTSRDPSNATTGEQGFWDGLELMRQTLRADPSVGGLCQRAFEDIEITMDEPTSDSHSVYYHAVLTTEAITEMTA